MDKYLPVFSKSPFRQLIFVINVLLGALTTLLVLIVTYYVIARYFFRMGFYGFEEIVTLIAVWLYFLGAARASMEQSHISADMVQLFVSNPKTIRWVHLCKRIVSLVFLLVLIVLCVDFLHFNILFPSRTVYRKIPRLVYYFSMITGFGFMLVFEVTHLIHNIKAIRTGDPDQPTEEGEMA